MDLELTDEQTWLSESIETLLEREWPAPEQLTGVTVEQRWRVWLALVEFGALSIGPQDGELGAVEACLIARSLGAHLASVPFIGSAAVRLALGTRDSHGAGDEHDAIALAILEPGSSWPDAQAELMTTLQGAGTSFELHGEKVAVEQLDLADRIAVLAALDGEPALAVIDSRVESQPQASFDETLPFASLRFDGTPATQYATPTVHRLNTAGALLAAAEAIGAAGRVLDDACRYAAQRRQFGRPIASFQALRHILADMYVRHASGTSAVLYAAAAFDDGAADATQAAAVAKAYVSRAARDVAHGAMQVFGGIAFTHEHPAHRFLRRIVVREQQFGDANHHERALGRELARVGANTRTPATA